MSSTRRARWVVPGRGVERTLASLPLATSSQSATLTGRGRRACPHGDPRRRGACAELWAPRPSQGPRPAWVHRLEHLARVARRAITEQRELAAACGDRSTWRATPAP